MVIRVPFVQQAVYAQYIRGNLNFLFGVIYIGIEAECMQFGSYIFAYFFGQKHWCIFYQDMGSIAYIVAGILVSLAGPEFPGHKGTVPMIQFMHYGSKGVSYVVSGVSFRIPVKVIIVCQFVHPGYNIPALRIVFFQ
jgi:hypothetical protein